MVGKVMLALTLDLAEDILIHKIEYSDQKAQGFVARYQAVKLAVLDEFSELARLAQETVAKIHHI